MAQYLEFEKPIAKLEGKIEELRHLSGSSSLNIADEVARLQQKVERQIRQTYAKLTPWQKVQVARHPERPHAVDYISALVEDWTPLAGRPGFFPEDIDASDPWQFRNVLVRSGDAPLQEKPELKK